MAQVDRPILPQYLFRYRPLPDEKTLNREIRTIKEQYIWLPQYRELNDPMEGFYEATKRFQSQTTYGHIARDLVDAKRNIGICSFSDTCENELMWAHYATNYSGMCVGYRPQSLVAGLPSDVHLVRLAARREQTSRTLPQKFSRTRKLLGPMSESGARLERPAVST